MSGNSNRENQILAFSFMFWTGMSRLSWLVTYSGLLALGLLI